MGTRRKMSELYTEVKQVVDGEVVQTTCCCEAAGATRKGCATVAGNKTPCRCACHASQKKAD